MKKNIQYIVNMSIGIFVYGLGLVGLNYWYLPNSSIHYWLILLPVIPIVYIVTIIIRQISKMDEMYRKIITEAMAFSGLTTGFTCFSYLFLRDMGAPEFKAEWAFFVMWFYFAVGMLLSSRRYR